MSWRSRHVVLSGVRVFGNGSPSMHLDVSSHLEPSIATHRILHLHRTIPSDRKHPSPSPDPDGPRGNQERLYALHIPAIPFRPDPTALLHIARSRSVAIEDIGGKSALHQYGTQLQWMGVSPRRTVHSRGRNGRMIRTILEIREDTSPLEGRDNTEGRRWMDVGWSPRTQRRCPDAGSTLCRDDEDGGGCGVHGDIRM